MREIKFRAWDKEEKKMYTYDDDKGHFVVSFNGETEKIAHGSTPFNLSLPQNLELMQYTGLLDKNGTPIFEGDLLILGDKNARYEVFYHDGNGRYGFRPHYSGNRCGGYIPELNNESLEVIGNIYENPELLTPATK